MKDRCRGALIGLAVGDALAAAVEFSSPGSFAPVTGYRSGGPHGLKAGEWTDDTSMALALADSTPQYRFLYLLDASWADPAVLGAQPRTTTRPVASFW